MSNTSRRFRNVFYADCLKAYQPQMRRQQQLRGIHVSFCSEFKKRITSQSLFHDKSLQPSLEITPLSVRNSNINRKGSNHHQDCNKESGRSQLIVIAPAGKQTSHSRISLVPSNIFRFLIICNSASLFSFICEFTLGSQPSNLIIRMTFMAGISDFSIDVQA